MAVNAHQAHHEGKEQRDDQHRAHQRAHPFVGLAPGDALGDLLSLVGISGQDLVIKIVHTRFSIALAAQGRRIFHGV